TAHDRRDRDRRRRSAEPAAAAARGRAERARSRAAPAARAVLASPGHRLAPAPATFHVPGAPASQHLIALGAAAGCEAGTDVRGLPAASPIVDACPSP